MVDEGTLRRLLQSDARRLNDAVLDKPMLLGTLRTERDAALWTRAGVEHRVDPAVVEALWQHLSPLARATLQVPIRVHAPHDLDGVCFVPDPHAFLALAQMGVAGAPRDGRLWLSIARALDLARSWPGIVQLVRQ